MSERARSARLRRTLLLAAGIAVVGVLAAGCGGSGAPSVASIGATTAAASGTSTSGATSTTTTRPSSAALASCFTSHGFSASIGSASAAGSRTLSVFGVTIGGNVDPDSPQFQKAMQACRKFIPGGGPPAQSPAQHAASVKALASFAACMRKDGVPSFPDPKGTGQFFDADALARLDPSSPVFQKAYKACESLMPKVGPRISFG